MSQATDALNAPEKSTKRSGAGRIAILLLLTGMLLILTWFGWKAWRIYRSGSSLVSRQAEFQALAAGGLQAVNPDELEALVMGVRADTSALIADTAFLMPLMPYLSSAPEIGPLAGAAPHLVEMADAATEAAAYGMRGMKPAFVAMQSDERETALLPLWMQTVNTARPDLAQVALAVDRAASARALITNEEALPWRVRTLLALSDEWLERGQKLSRIALVLPEMMGFDGPRRYLILAQNQDELRPTGGFISGVGYLEVDQGNIVELDFVDANMIDAWTNDDAFTASLVKPYAEPPLPLQEFMMLGLFLFRDANFWPDFAVSAQKAMDLYAYGRDVEALDGAIGIDQDFLQLLLEGTGPVTLPDSGEIISGDTVIAGLQEAWTLQEGVRERKAFLGPFALAILNRINGGLSDTDPISLMQKLSQSLEQKDMQIYMRDAEPASILRANNWDGRLAPPSNYDALLIVDTNVGYNKANYFVDRSAEYDVQLVDEGSHSATLAVTHRHRDEADGESCWQGTTEEYVEGATYLDLTDKCYWNYLRIYVPEGAELQSGPQHLIPGETWFGGFDWQRETETLLELPGFTTFASWMLLPKGEEIVSEFRYTLPASIVQTDGDSSIYSLRLLKQPGTSPNLVHVRVTPPAGKQVVGAFPDPVAIEGSTVIFSVELDQDQTVALAYR